MANPSNRRPTNPNPNPKPNQVGLAAPYYDNILEVETLRITKAYDKVGTVGLGLAKGTNREPKPRPKPKPVDRTPTPCKPLPLTRSPSEQR